MVSSIVYRRLCIVTYLIKPAQRLCMPPTYAMTLNKMTLQCSYKPTVFYCSPVRNLSNYDLITNNKIQVYMQLALNGCQSASILVYSSAIVHETNSHGTVLTRLTYTIRHRRFLTNMFTYHACTIIHMEFYAGDACALLGSTET